jgi:hypothetical protein
MHLPLPAFGLTLIFSIALCVHAVRTGRELFWLWIILFGLPPIGGIVYFIAVLLPSIMGGPTVRGARQAAQATLDPTRAYRQSKAALANTPTVANRMRLAEAAGGLGSWDEALAQYREAAQGVHAEDPALMEGLARALVELGRYAEALPILERLGLDGDPGHTPQIGLLFARTYEGLGRPADADAYFQSAGLRTPGLEGLARYAAFKARMGRADDARQMLDEIDQRLSRTNPRFQKEGRVWRDLAAEAISKAR